MYSFLSSLRVTAHTRSHAYASTTWMNDLSIITCTRTNTNSPPGLVSATYEQLLWMSTTTLSSWNRREYMWVTEVSCVAKFIGPDEPDHFVTSQEFWYRGLAWCKTAVTPLLMHWSYCSLARSHQCIVKISNQNEFWFMKCVCVWPCCCTYSIDFVI